MDVFTEIFPLATDATPRLYAYALTFDDPPPDDPARVARALARRLAGLSAQAARWLWHDGRLLSTEERGAVELEIALDVLRADDPSGFGAVTELTPQGEITGDPLAVADFVIRTAFKPLDAEFDAALAAYRATIPAPPATARATRDPLIRPWAIDDTPAVSVGITTRLSYEHNLQLFTETLTEPRRSLVGLRVRDRASGRMGEIVAVSGRLSQRRAHILRRAPSEVVAQAVAAAAGAGWAVRVRFGARRLEYPALALEPLIRPQDFPLFRIDPRDGNRALTPPPDQRAMMVRALSEVAKSRGLIDKAYNSREYPARFLQVTPEPYLRWGNRRTRPYQPERLAYDLIQCGAYHLRELYRDDPIEVCVVNAVAMPVADFVEALQRQLARGFSFSIEVLRERRVRVVSPENIASAIKVVEKESPDIILAFLPDEDTAPNEPDADPSAPLSLSEYIRSLTLGRGIPTAIIHQRTLDDPESMPGIIMAILARTGNTPFALADPLTEADQVAGLHLVRDLKNQRLTGIARLYRADGVFVRYAVRTVALTDPASQFVFLRELFPQRDFAGQRVVIHHEGVLPADLHQALALWGRAINARFAVVEVIRRGAPRLYGLANGRIVAPPAGCAFVLTPSQACIVLATPPDQPTPQPVIVHAHGIGIEPALRSLRLWMTLSYAPTAPDVPVTITNASALAGWIRKGGTFSETEGETPFWL